MTSANDNFIGIVLAGGRSSRMGRDKASLEIGGRSMLFRTISTLRSISTCETVIVVAAENQTLPLLPNEVTIVRDRLPDRGPLEGFATGLSAVNQDQSNIRKCFLVSCDAPFIVAPFVNALVCECEHAFDAVVPVYLGFPQPLAAAYSVGILSTINDLLANEERSMKSLLNRISCRYVDADSLRMADPELLSLRNLNTPADFDWAVQMAERMDLR